MRLKTHSGYIVTKEGDRTYTVAKFRWFGRRPKIIRTGISEHEAGRAGAMTGRMQNPNKATDAYAQGLINGKPRR